MPYLWQPFPFAQLPILSLRNDRSHIARGRLERAQAPPRTIAALKYGRFTGYERYIEIFERNLQPLTSRLYVSFFARPAIEKSLGPQILRKSTQFRQFTRGKIAFRNIITGELGPDQFHIDSNLPAERECVDGQSVRVREIEIHAGTEILCLKRRLVLWPEIESQAIRRCAQVGSQQCSENASTCDEMVPVAEEVKSRSACRFGGVQSRLEAAKNGGFTCERSAPDVNHAAG